MCLILFAVDTHPDFAIIVAANRDEFYRRRTHALGRWPEAPIIGGRDGEAGGTWLGLHAERTSRIAMVTNVRNGSPAGPGPRSRGELPVEFLTGDASPEAFAQTLPRHADDYAPVNLLVADDGELWWATNFPEPQAQRVAPGVHGLSNGALDSNWPKVTDGRDALAAVVGADRPDGTVEPYLELLANDTRPAIDRLPDTGVPAQREQDLSPVFVRMRGYGTRASTVLRVGRNGHGDITERRFTYRGRQRGTTTVRF
ncbi:NRDE family protein [Gordonia sp. CPCC 205515]|uniref:NRDE family protein n=1 Tax=Gordonia sp. CPCC 205515 TaxID=3140791 RepID=UPI003AF3BF97